MSRRIGVICLVLALSVPAYATPTGMTVYWDVPTSGNGDWWLSPANEGPVYTTAALTQVTMVTPESDSGGYADGQLQGLGQMFSPGEYDIDAGAISIKIAGIGTGEYGVAIYDIGPASNYTSITPDPYNVSTKTPEFSASFTTAARGAQVIVFNFYGGTLDLYAGEKYAFVITETVASALVWIRGNPQTPNAMGITTNGGGGGMNVWKNIRDYGGPPTTDTTDTRDFTFAIYLVPEPATMALLGLGGLALLRRKH